MSSLTTEILNANILKFQFTSLEFLANFVHSCAKVTSSLRTTGRQLLKLQIGTESLDYHGESRFTHQN